MLDNTIPNEGEFAPSGVPIAHIVNTAIIKIVAEVPERNASTITRGMPGVITVDALPGDTLEGKVSFVGSTVSAANRSLTVELVLANPFRRLKPEMVANVRLLREAKKNAIMVDENLMQLVDRDRTIVYVENGGKAEERRLTLGGREGNRIEVVEGLKTGDRLIVAGYQKLVDGSPVIVTQ
jgi:membrane fusion protein (multidrug efflux system)